MTIASRRLLIAPFLLAALAVTAMGCGASPSRSGAALAPKVTACELFTDADAQQIAGDTLASMTSTLDDARGHNPLECIYNSGNLEQPRILSLLLRQHGSTEAAKDLQESSRSTLSSMSGGKVQDVPGLGDGALWVGDASSSSTCSRGASSSSSPSRARTAPTSSPGRGRSPRAPWNGCKRPRRTRRT